MTISVEWGAPDSSFVWKASAATQEQLDALLAAVVAAAIALQE
jgi:hypothetical protein